MSGDFRIRGVAKPITGLTIKPQKVSQFDEVMRESEQLISEVNMQDEEILSLNPDLSFSLKQITSIYLDHNTRFQDLKKALENYHLDCRRKHPQMHPGKSSQWKQIVYTSLHRLLNECLYTNVRKLQLEYLNKVYDWYYTKVGVLSEPEQNTQIELRKTPEYIEEEAPDRLSQYSRRKIQSSASLRPKTANTVHSKLFDSRPPSAAIKLPIQAFTGAGEPREEIPEVEFETSYISYTPVGEEAEKNAEIRFKENRMKDLAEKRLRDEMRAKVDSWTLVRARKTEEFNRKFESNRFGSKFDNRAYSPSRPHTAGEALNGKKERVFEMIDPEIEKVEKDVNGVAKTVEVVVQESKPLHKMSKIDTIRKMHGEILEGDESVDEPNNILDYDPTAVTLSAYSKSGQIFNREVSRPHTAGYLPPARNILSRGLNGPNRPVTAQRAGQIDEIYEVKKHLAKKNIPCSIDTIKYGLLMPEDLPPESLTHLSLPIAGSGLLSNPFLKLGKKAGKGKKKGKKGKKSKK